MEYKVTWSLLETDQKDSSANYLQWLRSNTMCPRE